MGRFDSADGMLKPIKIFSGGMDELYIITNLDQLHCQFEKVAMALGTSTACTLPINLSSVARSNGELPACWNQHGLYVCQSSVILDPSASGATAIETLAGKTAQIKNQGVTVLVRIPFTKALLHLPPEDFVYLLATKIKPKHIVVGPNHSFGDKGAGNPAR